MPVRRVKAQPRVWPLNTEPPPWVWTMPSAAGLCALSSTPHATLLNSARPPPPPPPLRTVTSWQLSCDPFLPPLISPLPVPNIQVTSYFLPTSAMFTYILFVFKSSCVIDLQRHTKQHPQFNIKLTFIVMNSSLVWGTRRGIFIDGVIVSIYGFPHYNYFQNSLGSS